MPIHAKQATDGVYNSLQQLGLLKAMQDEAGRQPIENSVLSIIKRVLFDRY